MDSTFRERIDNVNEVTSWSDVLPEGKEKGTITCPFCLKKGKGYLYPNFFKCFSSRCAVQGDKIAVFQKLNNITFMQALNALEDKACLDPKKQAEEFEKRDRILNDVLDAYHDQLLQNPSVIDYLEKRGFNIDFIKMMRIGYAPPSGSILSLYPISINSLLSHHLATTKYEFFWNRIIFPVYNVNGYLVHLTGRKFLPDGKEDMKWLDSKAVPVIGSCKNYLLFEHELSSYRHRSDTLYLVEGVPDAFIMKQLGYPVVGIMGLQKLLYHTSKLETYGFKNLVAVFDNDRYEIDHPYYPGELKSWRVTTNQLIDLQLYFGKKMQVDVCMIPEDIETEDGYVKDVNDLFMKYGSKSIVQDVLEANRQDLIVSILKEYGGDFSYHRVLLKLVSTTGRCRDKLAEYIPEEYDPLTYSLKVLST